MPTRERSLVILQRGGGKRVEEWGTYPGQEVPWSLAVELLSQECYTKNARTEQFVGFSSARLCSTNSRIMPATTVVSTLALLHQTFLPYVHRTSWVAKSVEVHCHAWLYYNYHKRLRSPRECINIVAPHIQGTQWYV